VIVLAREPLPGPGLTAAAAAWVPSDVSLSILMASSFGLLRIASSVGVSGDMGMAATGASVIPRSWSATAFLGLSAPDEGAGLPRGGVEAGRRASVVLSNGTNGGCSRLRLGEGLAKCVGGISPTAALT
jgi:hypothetical protein